MMYYFIGEAIPFKRKIKIRGKRRFINRYRFKYSDVFMHLIENDINFIWEGVPYENNND